MAFSSTNLLQIAATLTSAGDLVGASAPLSISQQITFTEGTGANQANRVWSDTRTLTASATEDLDLAGSALLDPYGAAVVFARVKGLFVRAASGNTNNVVLGGVTNGWAALISPAASGLVTLRPGAVLAVFDPSATGMAVTAGTGDLLHVANSAGSTSVTYDIVIIGSAT